VGGFVLREFIKRDLFGQTGILGVVDLGASHGIKTGEQVHEFIFQSGKTKFPHGWAQILAFF
jgi:hypothetical protein